MPHPYTRIYYAQLIQPREGHPTARVLECSYLRTQPNNQLRLRHPSTKWGIAANPRHCTPDATLAAAILKRRVGEQIESHVRAIRDLKSSLKRFNATALITYPSPLSP